LSHGYALTIHKAQGVTVDRAYVLAGESLSQESGYVAMSRARELTELFVPLAAGEDDQSHDTRRVEVPDPLSGLRRRLGNSRAKRLAAEQLDGEALTDKSDGRPKARCPGNGPSETRTDGVYRLADASREVVGSAAMSAGGLNESMSSEGSTSESIRGIFDVERRRAATRAGHASLLELNPGGRSRGRDR
jgi:hypothetical protein